MKRKVYVIFRNTSVHHIDSLVWAIRSWDEVEDVTKVLHPNKNQVLPRVYHVLLKDRVNPSSVLQRLKSFIEIGRYPIY